MLRRYQLATKYDAPIGNSAHAKSNFEDESRKKARSAGNALLRNSSKIPLPRIQELQTILQKYFEVSEFETSLIEKGANLSVTIANENVDEDEKFVEHGQKIVNIVTEKGQVYWFCQEFLKIIFSTSIQSKFKSAETRGINLYVRKYIWFHGVLKW